MFLSTLALIASASLGGAAAPAAAAAVPAPALDGGQGGPVLVGAALLELAAPRPTLPADTQLFGQAILIDPKGLWVSDIVVAARPAKGEADA